VYAIEPGDCIQIARDLAEANGFSGRIEFIQELSTKVTLPERADVIVADLRGILPLYGASLPSMIDARERFLAPGGALIPQADRLWGTVIEASESYRRGVLAWEPAMSGFDSLPVTNMAANSIYKIRTRPDEYLAAPCELVSIDYRVTTSPSYSSIADWNVLRAGTAHGIAIWFDAELTDGVGFSNNPERPELLYGTAFFPFREPLTVSAGDQISSHMRADVVGDDYVWRWNSSLNGKLQFEQSTFFGMPVSTGSLQRRSSS
jgi:protein arginine N-methyltransferase 1